VSAGWLTRDGLVAAVVVGGLVLWGGGIVGVALLMLFFVSGSVLTAWNQRQHGQDGQEGQRSFPRTARQVIANGAWAAIGAALVRWKPDLGWAALVGALATAQADTWATEIGAHARGAPRLITTGRPVAAGTSGGVTWLGTGAGILGALALGGVGLVLGVPSRVVAAGVVVGMLGMLLDSVAGATLEARSWLDNDGVNLAATSFGAVATAAVVGLTTP
jgi:uncharacterized protein (TIGR00297 family)